MNHFKSIFQRKTTKFHRSILIKSSVRIL
jgi:hypothetical protein